MKILTLEQIKSAVPALRLMPAIEAGFVAYSKGEAIVPPVGELLLERGEVHIKYGCIRQSDCFVIKVASGFYGNPAVGLPSSQGLMMLFSQKTGQPVCLLLDEGFLTDTRTAIAGAIAAKHLAPPVVNRVGIVGTGVQARMQLRALRHVVECSEVLIWGRGATQLRECRRSLSDTGFRIEVTLELAAIQESCNLIVTTTPATEPLLRAAGLRPGTHITAVGSDTPFKQELEAAILERADVVVADSKSQCLERGEIHQAIQAGLLDPDRVIELGSVIAGDVPGRLSGEQITVADLTGVAVQDLQIAEAVFRGVQTIGNDAKERGVDRP